MRFAQLGVALPPQQLASSGISESQKGGPSLDASLVGLLAVPERFVRELCRFGGANGVQRWCLGGR